MWIKINRPSDEDEEEEMTQGQMTSLGNYLANTFGGNRDQN